MSNIVTIGIIAIEKKKKKRVVGYILRSDDGEPPESGRKKYGPTVKNVDF